MSDRGGRVGVGPRKRSSLPNASAPFRRNRNPLSCLASRGTHPTVAIAPVADVSACQELMFLSMSHGDERALAALEDLCFDLADAGNDVLLLLCFHIDDTAIPSPSLLDDKRGCIPVLLAAVALRALAVFVATHGLPEHAMQSLWPRVLSWTTFLESYMDAVLPLCQVANLRLAIAAVCFSLQKSSVLVSEITRSSVVQTCVGKAWVDQLQRGSADGLGTLASLVELLAATVVAIKAVQPLLDAVGGTYPQLFSALRKQVVIAASNSADTRLFFESFQLLVAVLNAEPDALRPFVQSGVVKDVVSALRALTLTRQDPTDPWFMPPQALLSLLSGFIDFSSAAVAEALDAGLISALRLRLDDGQEEVQAPLRYLLGAVIPRALVSHCVVERMKGTSEHLLEGAALMAKLRGSPLAMEWTSLLALTKERIAVSDSWKLAKCPRFAGCDNMKCTVFGHKRNLFRCCSACRNATYCSRDCQVADWKLSHRRACPVLRQCTEEWQDWSCRDRGFLRWLLTCHYKQFSAARVLAALEKVEAFRRYGPKPIVQVIFDFTEGRPRVFVACRALDSMQTPDVSPTADTPLAIYCDRVRRSEGRLELHMVELGSGPHYRQLVLPMRTESSKLHHALAGVAAASPDPSMDPDGSLTRDLVRDMVEAHSEANTEFHC
ncbi:hypothetical protein C8R43DRAFT_1118529 [Mycena crocata]|nr:hypothetical protein C8R43DRAFT_1143114 [Mycena crocata]KAJ7177544.1 hypothetical protein C8R43DRAFT_1118529 [Mycena crocata]